MCIITFESTEFNLYLFIDVIAPFDDYYYFTGLKTETLSRAYQRQSRKSIELSVSHLTCRIDPYLFTNKAQS